MEANPILFDEAAPTPNPKPKSKWLFKGGGFTISLDGELLSGTGDSWTKAHINSLVSVFKITHRETQKGDARTIEVFEYKGKILNRIHKGGDCFWMPETKYNRAIVDAAMRQKRAAIKKGVTQ